MYVFAYIIIDFMLLNHLKTTISKTKTFHFSIAWWFIIILLLLISVNIEPEN